MDLLWRQGPATVVAIHDGLRETRVVSQPTVATLLRRLAERGLVAQTFQGRRAVYRAVVAREGVQAEILDEFAELSNRLFADDRSSLVSGLLDRRLISVEELRQIRALVEQRERECDAGEQ